MENPHLNSEGDLPAPGAGLATALGLVLALALAGVVFGLHVHGVYIDGGLLREDFVVTSVAGLLFLTLAGMLAASFIFSGGNGQEGKWRYRLYAFAAFLFLAASAMPRHTVIYAGSMPQVPYQLPGPADEWRDGMADRISVNAPGGGAARARVRLSLYESHDKIPPKLKVTAGDCLVGHIQVSPGAGTARKDWQEKGKASSYQMNIPARCLAQDPTVVEFTPVKGSWVAVDRVEVTGLPAWWEVWRHVLAPWSYLFFWGAMLLLAIDYLAPSGRLAYTKRKIALGAMMWLMVAAAMGGILCLLAVYVEIMTPWMVAKDGNVRERELFWGQKFIRDRELGWRQLPNYTGKTRRSGDSPATVFYAVNNEGFRALDQEREFPSRGKAMMLGDSFAEGMYLAQNETMAAVMARRLGGYVYNFGVVAYSTDQEYTVFKKWIDRIDVDWVVLQFCVNDVQYTDKDRAHKFAKPMYAMEEGKVDFDRLLPLDAEFVREANEEINAKRELEDISCCFTPRPISLMERIPAKALDYFASVYHPGALFSMIRADVRRTKAVPLAKHLSVTEEMIKNPGRFEAQFDIVFQFIKRIQEETEKRDKKFLMLVIPDILQVMGQNDPARANFRDKVMAMCGQHNVPCLDPSGELVKRSRFNGTYFIDDGHFSPYGAEVVGGMVADVIQGGK